MTQHRGVDASIKCGLRVHKYDQPDAVSIHYWLRLFTSKYAEKFSDCLCVLAWEGSWHACANMKVCGLVCAGQKGHPGFGVMVGFRMNFAFFPSAYCINIPLRLVQKRMENKFQSAGIPALSA